MVAKGTARMKVPARWIFCRGGFDRALLGEQVLSLKSLPGQGGFEPQAAALSASYQPHRPAVTGVGAEKGAAARASRQPKGSDPF